jgi:hypothetical protein
LTIKEAPAGRTGSAGSVTTAGSDPAEADRAMDRLGGAFGLGCRNLDTLRTEAALGPLRDRPDFKLLMMHLAMPADVFARNR